MSLQCLAHGGRTALPLRRCTLALRDNALGTSPARRFAGGHPPRRRSPPSGAELLRVQRPDAAAPSRRLELAVFQKTTRYDYVRAGSGRLLSAQGASGRATAVLQPVFTPGVTAHGSCCEIGDVLRSCAPREGRPVPSPWTSATCD